MWDTAPNHRPLPLPPPTSRKIVNFGKYIEIRFFEPSRETKIGSKNRRVQEIGGKITVFDWETTFGSNYRKVQKVTVREIGIPP